MENAQAVLGQTDAYLREDMGIDAETPSHKRRNRGNRLEEFIKAEEQDMSGKSVSSWCVCVVCTLCCIPGFLQL